MSAKRKRLKRLARRMAMVGRIAAAVIPGASAIADAVEDEVRATKKKRASRKNKASVKEEPKDE